MTLEFDQPVPLRGLVLTDCGSKKPCLFWLRGGVEVAPDGKSIIARDLSGALFSLLFTEPPTFMKFATTAFSSHAPVTDVDLAKGIFDKRDYFRSFADPVDVAAIHVSRSADSLLLTLLGETKDKTRIGLYQYKLTVESPPLARRGHIPLPDFSKVSRQVFFGPDGLPLREEKAVIQ